MLRLESARLHIPRAPTLIVRPAAIFRRVMVSPCVDEHQPKSTGTENTIHYLGSGWPEPAASSRLTQSHRRLQYDPTTDPPINQHTVDHLPHHTPPPFNTLRFPRAGSKGQMTLQHPQPSLQQSRSWAQTAASGCTNMGNTNLFNRCFWGFVISEARRALEFTSISWFFIFSPSSSPGLA